MDRKNQPNTETNRLGRRMNSELLVITVHLITTKERLAPPSKTHSKWGNMMRMLIYTILLLILGSNISYSQEWKLYNSLTNNIPNDHINSVVVDANNIKWFGTDEGLVSFDGVEWYTHSVQNKINFITNNSFMPNDELWLTTDDGIIRLKVISADAIVILNEYKTYNSSILSDTCISMQIDEGNVSWIGTDNGLSLLNRTSWINLTDEHGFLPHNVIRYIQIRLDGYNYLATEGGGIARLKYDEIDGITSASVIDTEWSQLPSDSINTIYFDSENTAWYGTDYGLSKHTGDNIKRNWKTYTSSDGLVNDTILALSGDVESNIWVGTANGVSRFYGNTWDKWSTKAQSAGDSVLSISQDNDALVWLCTNKGILSFSPPPTYISDNHAVYAIGSFHLSVYPNPFNSTATINYTLTDKDHVKLTVFNLLGKKVTTLVNEIQNVGNYNVQFNAFDLPSGLYYCMLSRGSQNVVNRMLLIK